MLALTAVSQEDLFDSFVSAICQELGALEGQTLDGIGEVDALPVPVAYAVSAAHSFAAFRWSVESAADPRLSQGYCEAFCLPTSVQGELRIGLFSQLTQHPSAHQGLDSVVAWAHKQGLVLTEPANPLPGFIELSAVLAANGQVTTSGSRTAALVKELQTELESSRVWNASLQEEVRRLKAKLHDVKESREAKEPLAVSASDVQAVSRFPATLDELQTWSSSVEGKLVLTPRALNGAKKSLYERPELVYAGLEFLAGAYREYRLGVRSIQEMDKALAEAGLRIAGSVSPSVAGALGDTYFVSWAGRQRFMDLHLLRGGGRDERYCMRIYFFWDDESQQCVVGWLPSHLDNSLS